MGSDKELELNGNQIDNEGIVYVPNREARRRNPLLNRIVSYDYVQVTENYTKSTHRMKKEKLKNAKRTEYRKRAAARTRKARQESNSQVS